MKFTREELEELKRFDAEVDEAPLTLQDYHQSAELDREVLHDRKDNAHRRVAAQQKAYYEANRERVAAQQKAYREANRERVAAQRREAKQHDPTNENARRGNQRNQERGPGIGDHGTFYP